MRVCQAGDQQNTGPHLDSSRLLQQVHWEDQRGKCKTFPIWNSQPLRKPVGGRPSSLHKETAFCPLIPNGPLKDCPHCLLFLRVFSPSTETSSSGHPSEGCCFCSCLFYFSSREPTLFQEQDPRTKGMQVMHVA